VWKKQNDGGQRRESRPCGKYDVSRQLEAAPSAMKIAPAVNLLEAA
jgi:hypothetical protein